jgi:hypothetical protein
MVSKCTTVWRAASRSNSGRSDVREPPGPPGTRMIGGPLPRTS